MHALVVLSNFNRQPHIFEDSFQDMHIKQTEFQLHPATPTYQSLLLDSNAVSLSQGMFDEVLDR